MASSYRQWTGLDLAEPELEGDALVQALENAPFVLVSHGTEQVPVFNYGNRAALTLFEMTWGEFTSLPSRLSAEPDHRDERQRLMDAVAAHGFIADYRGVRISKSDRRFTIENVRIWNLVDADGTLLGQAAMYPDWRYLEVAD